MNRLGRDWSGGRRRVLAALLFVTGSASAFDEKEVKLSNKDVDKFFSEDNIKKVTGGETILIDDSYENADGEAVSRTFVMGHIAKPPKAVWAVILDSEKHPEFMPTVTSKRKYEVDGDRYGTKTEVSTILMNLTYHTIHEPNIEEGYAFIYMDHSRENDLADTASMWFIRPHGKDGEASIVLYTQTLRTGFPVPETFEKMMVRTSLPNVINNIKKRAESDGTWTKD